MNKKQYLIDLQPIRSIEQLNDMKWSLKRHCSDLDYILFLIEINTFRGDIQSGCFFIFYIKFI
ncbi:hypothetical protein QCQ72_004135 [Bacillus cereus]|nr:hypothetical protein [Bacillus cereus]